MISNLNQLYRQDNVRIRKIENVFYLVCGRACYEINETGALIVNAIGKDLSIDKVCEKLSQIYKYTEIEQIRDDVEKFIEFIVDNGIVNTKKD